MQWSVGMAAGLLSIFAAPAAGAAGLSALAANAEQFNGRAVTVRGSVANFQQSAGGPAGSYAMFSICSGGCVRVYTTGTPKLSNGQAATVSGTFTTVDHVNGNIYYNQIDSTVLEIHPDDPTAVPR